MREQAWKGPCLSFRACVCVCVCVGKRCVLELERGQFILVVLLAWWSVVPDEKVAKTESVSGSSWIELRVPGLFVVEAFVILVTFWNVCRNREQTPINQN